MEPTENSVHEVHETTVRIRTSVDMKLLGPTNHEIHSTTKDAHSKSSKATIEGVKWMMWVRKETPKKDHKGQDKCNNTKQHPRRGFHSTPFLILLCVGESYVS